MIRRLGTLWRVGGHGGARSTGADWFRPYNGSASQRPRSLVERCRAENEIVAVSIFVNPSQFNDPNDLAAISAHPR